MVDLDNMFKYCTPKYVYIRNAKLGIMKYLIMAMIFFYVVIYEIMYTCTHLELHHAKGFGTIKMVQPGEECADGDHECLQRFHNVAKLPYCQQEVSADSKSAARELAGKPTKAPSADDEEDGHGSTEAPTTEAPTTEAVGESITQKKMCRYLDHHRLEFDTNPSEIFIPTHYRRTKQKIDPKCYNPDAGDPAAGSPTAKYRCKDIWVTTEVKEYYIADIESFKLKFSHSYTAPDIAMHGVSTEHQGFFAACPNNHPSDVKTECKRTKVPNTSGAAAAEDLVGLSSTKEMGIPSLTGTPTGEDEISVRDLLKTTPVAQDHHLETPLDAQLPAGLGHPGKSLREVGGMVLLDVDYSNDAITRPGFHGLLGPRLAVKPVTYEYRPSFVPTRTNTINQVIQRDDDAQTRTVDVWHGITIKFQFNGRLVKFSWQGLLKSLTTALVLVTMASTLVGMFAAYVAALSEKYCLLMYQLSEDFSDYCNYKGSVAGDVWTKTQATRPGGKMLLDKLNGDMKLTDDQLIQLLCLVEMRLNRLDGQDPRLVFLEANESNPVNKAIGTLEKDFYQKTGMDETTMNSMAFNQRINPAAE